MITILMFLGYFAIGALVGCGAGAAFARYDLDDHSSYYRPDVLDWVGYAVLALLAMLIWPLVVVGYGLFLGTRRMIAFMQRADEFAAASRDPEHERLVDEAMRDLP